VLTQLPGLDTLVPCPDCDAKIRIRLHFFGPGNGRCRECSGSGKDPHLNFGERSCRNCGGTGTCPTCEGSGLAIRSIWAWLRRTGLK
jgi:hypothetical protein